MTELVGRTLANYTILDAIGQGGMATVYRARDIRDGAIVAIKVLSPYVAADPKFRGRFDREVNLLRRLEHPNIVPIIAFGQADGYHYIVMPYFAGGTLHDRLRAGPLLPLEGARIVEQISAALEFAHEKGIIHRDVKPSNILLGENGEAKLTDFGFAQVPWESASLTGSLLIGTPAYMSPEQCRGEKVGSESDQYSFGVVLYQVCTGRLPYEADTPMGVVIKQASQPLPPPRLANPNLPVAVEGVLIRVLAKKPEDRYESVAALNQAFQAAVKASIDPSGTYRLRQLRAEQPTENLPRRVVARAWAQYNLRRMRRFAPALAAVFVLGCPAAAWAFGILPPIGNGSPKVLEQSEDVQGFLATIDALSTQNAPLEGTVVTPGAVETSVYGTVVALGYSEAMLGSMTQQVEAAADSVTLTSTPSPTLTPYGFRTNTPTRTPTKQNTPLPGEPTWTPTRTPTRTPTPTWTVEFSLTPTATTPPPTPTDTLVPLPTDTDTPVPPPPTDTPVPPTSTPINPHACNDKIGNHNYCTPTPTPG
jgi:tRNA A-37 threonylcarbamoyl transferase component Bud32